LIQNLSHQGYFFNAIDLEETCTKLSSKRFAKVTQKSSHWQWIFNDKIVAQTLFENTDKARCRWFQEDQFNTLKNRGFSAKHDMSRAPHSQTVWKSLMLIASAVSFLMEISSLGMLARGTMSICNWIRDLWAELAKVPTEFLWNLPLPKQLRFFFDTS
jgi:hypothetical protein